ncbi:MAG: type II toxin-antitoxin system prevent-host-death family antitoxin, partial [Gemmatimonadota bacterium]|nr:type II toxin-antitoxin system prevent-host-death family antitoxin [Gemmatimonadota bacterium]
MSKMYSTYEAKAKFSEILRQVREGKTITISYHGEPVAEIRPIEKKQTLEERLDELERRGVLVRQPGERKPMKPG